VIVAYARTSTSEQHAGLEAQLRDLKAAGADRIFSEQVSSTSKRTALADCLAFIREGDVLLATKPDRLARSTTELLSIESDLSKRGIGLMILSMGGQVLDTRNPTAKLILTILGSVGCWEREIMLERQKEGIAKAKAEGRYRGRQPTARAKSAQIVQMAGQGKTREQIAEALQIGVASVYRVLRVDRAITGGKLR